MKFLYGLLSILLLVACQSSVKDSELKVFHYNQHNNINSLDPAFAKSQNNIWAVNHIYSTLVNLDDTLRILPAIAKRWDISEDGKIYTFYLNTSVKYHQNACFKGDSSRIVIASDVVYSFERLLDSTINAPGSWIFKNRVVKSSPFIALNDSIFQIRLERPFAPFLSLLTMQYCSIVPHEAVAYYGNEFYRNPVGTGPFYFGKWVSNQGLFLRRFDEYYEWQDGQYTSNLDAVRTSFIGERSIAFLELINGQIDFFTGVESSFIHTALDAKGDLRSKYDQVQLIKAPYLNFEYMGLYPYAPSAHPLLKEKEFRQALNYGINRPLMLSSLRKNIGIAADAGVIPRGLASYDPLQVKGYYYDKQKALDLLANFDNDLLHRPLIIHTSSDYLDLTTYIAKQWEDLGLTIKIEVLESAILRNSMRNGEISVFRASWIADYPDGENFLSMFYSPNPAPPNYTRFSHPQFDKWYELSIAETDEQKRIQLYQSMDRILIEEAPVIFLFYDEIAIFANKSIAGLSSNALNLLQVKSIQEN